MKNEKNVIQILIALKKIIPESFKGKIIFTIVLLVVNSIFEIFGIATLLPVFSLLISPEAIENSDILSSLYYNFNFQSITSFVIFLSIAVGIFILLKNIAGLLIIKYAANFTFSLYKYFCIKLYDNINRKGMAFLNNNSSSYLTRDITYSTVYLSQRLIWPAITLVNESILLLFIVIAIAVLAPGSVLVIFLLIIPFFIITYSIGKKYIENKARELHGTMGKYIELINESIFGYTDIVVLGKQQLFREKFTRLSSKLKEIHVVSQVASNLPTKIIEAFLIIALLLIFLYGIINKQADSSFITFLGFLGLAAFKILPSINRILLALIDIKSFSFAIDDLNETLVKIEDEDISNESYLNPDIHTSNLTFNSGISLDNVSYSYKDNHPVLVDINLKIIMGQTIGIIGRSGSGKSTLFKILLGFLYPQKGAISVDNVVLNKSDLAFLRKKMSYVSQEVYLMDASIMENIVFEREPTSVNLEKVNRVLELVELLDFVNGLPDHVHTNVGERGSLLSGGQKQRIGIARALYHNAEILLLDEATSALDQKTEEEISSAIFHLKKEAKITVIIIAHRYTTLRNCDIIYELKNGMIVKEYSYSQLLSEKGDQ